MRGNIARALIVAGIATALWLGSVAPVAAQIRGLYTPGMTATNSGMLPEAGLTYQGLFQVYPFDQLKGAEGESLPVNLTASVVADQNILMWVSKRKIFRGTYAVMADLPVVSNSITSVTFGSIAGGASFADSFYSPLTLGWQLSRGDVQASYGLFVPTGRFHAGAVDNTGAGYWAHVPSSGQTFYLTKDKKTALSAFEAYEFHTTQKDTDLHPGQTFDIDYSLMRTIALKELKSMFQVGLAGYGQYQTTDKSGPGVTPVIAANTRYRVNALGAAANMILPARKTSLGVKYFKEFSNRATVQGTSVQISAAMTF